MSQIRWKFKGMPNSYTTEQLEGAGWTYPQICQYGKPVYEVSTPAWVGVGLPPKGTKVTLENPHGDGLLGDQEDWLGSEVTVVHTYRNLFGIDLVVVERGDGAAQVFRASICCPAKQPAAIDREVAVSEMLRTPKTPLPEATAYALYDAGYRKVQP